MYSQNNEIEIQMTDETKLYIYIFIWIWCHSYIEYVIRLLIIYAGKDYFQWIFP